MSLKWLLNKGGFGLFEVVGSSEIMFPAAHTRKPFLTRIVHQLMPWAAHFWHCLFLNCPENPPERPERVTWADGRLHSSAAILGN